MIRFRARHKTLITGLCVVFLAWFSMKFYMDNSNDSETNRYVSTLTSNIANGTITTDGTGHYAMLAPYVVWPFTASLEWVTGAYQLRGFATARFVVEAVIYALAYLWYRRNGLGWLTSLVGLMLLSTSFAFAELRRGWELDKLIESLVFLLAALAAWDGRYVVLLGAAALAAANRETGIFVPLVVLAVLAERRNGFRAALRSWPVWACFIVCAAEVVWFRRQIPAPLVVPWEDLNLEQVVYVTGGLCLLPLLALVWAPTAPPSIKRLFFVVAPLWVAFVLATDRLEQGALLLALVAVVFVPVTLAGVEQRLRAPARLATPPA